MLRQLWNIVTSSLFIAVMIITAFACYLYTRHLAAPKGTQRNDQLSALDFDIISENNSVRKKNLQRQYHQLQKQPIRFPYQKALTITGWLTGSLAILSAVAINVFAMKFTPNSAYTTTQTYPVTHYKLYNSKDKVTKSLNNTEYVKIRANHHVYKISIKDDSDLNNASYVTVKNQPSNKPKYDKLTLTITKPKAKYRNLNGATTTRAVKVTHYVQKEGN